MIKYNAHSSLHKEESKMVIKKSPFEFANKERIKKQWEFDFALKRKEKNNTESLLDFALRREE